MNEKEENMKIGVITHIFVMGICSLTGKIPKKGVTSSRLVILDLMTIKSPIMNYRGMGKGNDM